MNKPPITPTRRKLILPFGYFVSMHRHETPNALQRPAIASLLQSTPPAGRVAELVSQLECHALSNVIRALVATAFVVGQAFATEQGRDAITFAGQQDSILECPLNDFLGRLPMSPRFDIPNTANYKGYTASWEVKDSRLYMRTFHATTNDQPYSISSLFPGRKLPIHADWYSGALHIVSGRETWAKGRYTYERVTTLQVTNGVVLTTNRMTNVKEDKLKR
jgi:hypothetical protein